LFDFLVLDEKRLNLGLDVLELLLRGGFLFLVGLLLEFRGSTILTTRCVLGRSFSLLREFGRDIRKIPLAPPLFFDFFL